MRLISMCAAAFAFAAAACVPAPGDACSQSGDGFSGSDSCRAFGNSSRCLNFPVVCPDGSEVTPDVCEGNECQGDADCDDTFVCAETGSATRNCVPASVCP
jgi:hypothetical protein